MLNDYAIHLADCILYQGLSADYYHAARYFMEIGYPRLAAIEQENARLHSMEARRQLAILLNLRK